MARPERLQAFEYVGSNRYFITCCTLNRRRVFDDADLVGSTWSHFLTESIRFGCAIPAYCFMPDHAHVLIEGTTGDADVRSLVSIAKQKSGFEFAARDGHRLWQKGYYDRVLRTDESTTDVIRYTVANPLRAGPVREPSEYPFWGSGTYTREALIELISSGEAR